MEIQGFDLTGTVWRCSVGSQFTVTLQKKNLQHTEMKHRIFRTFSLRWTNMSLSFNHQVKTLLIFIFSSTWPPVPSGRRRTCEAYQSEPTALHLIYVETQENKWMHHRLCSKKINIHAYTYSLALYASSVHFAFHSSIRQNLAHQEKIWRW